MMVAAAPSPAPSPPNTSSSGILNLDHYKYLRSLLPTEPYCIESLSFTDLGTWDCRLFVHLTNESDCLKWLADFEDKTSTSWKLDNDTSKALPKVKGCSWQLVYRCVSEGRRECPATLEMRIFSQEEGRSKAGKQHPCEVNISFTHNHDTQPGRAGGVETYKSQDIPSHLKEGFEGYFQETMSPIQPGLTTAPSSLSSSSTTRATTSSPQPVHLQLKVEGGVEEQVESTSHLLLAMLQQGGTAAAAVTHFVEKVEKLRHDPGQLEDALSSFGSQWDWLVHPDTTVGAVLNSGSPEATQVILAPQSPASPTSRKRVKREEEVGIVEGQQVYTSIVGAQSHVVVQQQQSVETPDSDMKRRKRARCGACTGCRNRDKTQDCRQCRNCLDQKRYGGPGRLKKACIKRQCAVISQMLAGEVEEKPPTLHSVPVTIPKPMAKAEPQETAVTLSARTDGGQVGGQAVSLLPAPPTLNLLASPGGGGQPQAIRLGEGQGQTISIGGQTYSLVGSPAVSLGGGSVSLGSAVTSSGGAAATIPTSAAGGSLASPLLSWPGAQFAPTFQVAQQGLQQQPVQFLFQPQGLQPQQLQVQYATQLEPLVGEGTSARLG